MRYNGVWDVTCAFESGLPGFRLIQRTEYEDAMSDGDMPDRGPDAEVRGNYVWVDEDPSPEVGP